MSTPTDQRDFVFLSAALDALDRLYDGESGARDVEAILRIGGMSISDRALGEQLVRCADSLRVAIGAALPGVLSGKEALRITDEVRVPIAEAWGELEC